MARRRYVRKAGGKADGGSAWISYSDMMAALLLVFLLVLCYSMYQYFVMLETKTAELDEKGALLSVQQTTLDEQQATLDAQKLELEEKQKALADATILLGAQQEAMSTQQQKLDDLVGVRTKIIRELSTALTTADLKASVDKNTGDIMLESAVFFDVGKNTIKPSGQQLLNEFIPVYLGVLLRSEYADYLGEIIIEGHTDTQGSYLMNLELSQERALSVASYCLQMQGLSEEQLGMLRSILTAKGRSFSDPIYNGDGTINMDASRRVEFKFRLKDSEMIDEIRQILTVEE